MEQLSGATPETAVEQELEPALYRFEHADGKFIESNDPMADCPHLAFIPKEAREMILEAARVPRPSEVTENHVEETVAQTKPKVEPKVVQKVEAKPEVPDALPPVSSFEQSAKAAVEPIVSPLVTLQNVLRANELEHIEREVDQDDAVQQIVQPRHHRTVPDAHIAPAAPVEALQPLEAFILPAPVEKADYDFDVARALPETEDATEHTEQVWQAEDSVALEQADSTFTAEVTDEPADAVEEYFFVGTTEVASEDTEYNEVEAQKPVSLFEMATTDEVEEPKWYEFDGAFELEEELPAPLSPVDFQEFITTEEKEVPLVTQLAAQIEALAGQEDKADVYKETKAILSLVMAELAKEFTSPEEALQDGAKIEGQLLIYIRRMLVCLELPDDSETVKKILELLMNEYQGTHERKSFGENWVSMMLAKTGPVRRHLAGRAVVHLSRPATAAA